MHLQTIHPTTSFVGDVNGFRLKNVSLLCGGRVSAHQQERNNNKNDMNSFRTITIEDRHRENPHLLLWIYSHSKVSTLFPLFFLQLISTLLPSLPRKNQPWSGFVLGSCCVRTIGRQTNEKWLRSHNRTILESIDESSWSSGNEWIFELWISTLNWVCSYWQKSDKAAMYVCTLGDCRRGRSVGAFHSTVQFSTSELCAERIFVTHFFDFMPQ